MSIQQNISEKDHFFIGEDLTVQFTVEDLTAPKRDDGTYPAKDVTGWTTSFKAALTPDGAAVITRSGVVTSAADGIIQVPFLAATTSALDPAEYHYTFARTDSGFNQVTAHGTLKLLPRPA